MCNTSIYTPLRYPGGKARFAPFIAGLLERNRLVGGHYLEPYAGGAGVAFHLLFNGFVSHIHINDIDPAITDFWKAITQETAYFIELIENTSVTMKQWKNWRTILKRGTKASLVERGFATFFINRTNRSGILNAGVIGGKQQSGAYKLDARFNKDVLVARIKKIAEHSDKISIYNEDALSLLKRCHAFLPKNSLIYLDPPYYVRGQRLYRNFYCDYDHKSIAEVLRSRDFFSPWVVSYDDVPEIRSMYHSEKQFRYNLRYSAQQQRVGKEIIFLNKKLICPRKLLSSMR